MLLFIISIAVALSLSFFCSLMEACLLSISSVDIAQIAEKKPRFGAIWKDFRERINRPITIILIINTFAHTVGATVSGSKFNELFNPKWIAVYSILFSLVMIQWTEILPKTMGVRYNIRIAMLMTTPMRGLIWLFSPFLRITELFNRPFEGSRGAKARIDAIQDINILARFAALNKMISNDQRQIITQSMDLSRAQVKDIMIKRGDIKFLSTGMSLQEALVEGHLHHHTRFPLVEENSPDRVIGYVNFKDIVSALQLNPQDPSLAGIARPILYVRPEDTLASALTRLTKGYQHMAVVRGRENTTQGLIALEDIIEFIFGDIDYEYDMLPIYVYPIAGNRYLAGGGIIMEQLHEKVAPLIPPLQVTLDEWLKEGLAKVPAVEDSLIFGNLKFIIRKIRRSRIYEVILERREVQ